MNALLALVGLVLVLFELLLIVRVVVDLVGSLASPEARYEGLGAVRRVIYRLTEPVLAPVRRVLPPLRLGSVALDTAFIAVFVAVLLLRQIVLGL